MTHMLLYDCCMTVWGFWGPWFKKKEVESAAACSSWTVLHAQSTSVLSSGFPLSQCDAKTREVRCENKASSDFLLSE